MLSMTATIFAALSAALWLLALPGTLYLGLLSLFSAKGHLPKANDMRLRFGVVVPAHNESLHIGATVDSLLAMTYPRDQFDVVVVADNCQDDTAQIAAQHGAQVLTRLSEKERGKGYALNFAFEILLARQAKEQIDALVVVDADTLVSPNLLHAFSARLANGAWAVQAEYGVRNPWASWRTRLMAVALAMFHRLRSLARERLGVSAGLRGNGMCFSRACLTKFKHEAVGLVEDVEYGIALGRGGVRVVYADEAQVLGEMVSQAQASESQRQRWEGGRKQLIKEQLWPLIKEAIKRRSLLLADLAWDLATPPLGRLGGYVGAGLVCAGLSAVALGHPPQGCGLWWPPVMSLCLYLGRGVVLSNLGMGAVTALLWAPVYLVWKIILALRPGGKNKAWVRTQRESEQ